MSGNKPPGTVYVVRAHSLTMPAEVKMTNTMSAVRSQQWSRASAGCGIDGSSTADTLVVDRREAHRVKRAAHCELGCKHQSLDRKCDGRDEFEE